MTRAQQAQRLVSGWHAMILVIALPLLAACAAGPATLDAAVLAAAGGGTLEVIGTQAAARETLTATAEWPTHTATPTDTPTKPPATATSTPTSTDTPSPTPLPSGTVTGTVRLRAGPGTVYPTLASLEGGEVARPIGQTEAGDWLLIVLEDGTEGWVPAENFSVDDPRVEPPVISDIPPTPTLPPVTLTPTLPPPTATPTTVVTSYTCDLSASREGGYVILTGLNWPPKAPITVSVTRHYNAPVPPPAGTSSVQVTTGDADDEIPNGFWFRWPTGTAYFDGTAWVMVDGPTTYTLSTWACSGSVTTSP